MASRKCGIFHAGGGPRASSGDLHLHQRQADCCSFQSQDARRDWALALSPNAGPQTAPGSHNPKTTELRGPSHSKNTRPRPRGFPIQGQGDMKPAAAVIAARWHEFSCPSGFLHSNSLLHLCCEVRDDTHHTTTLLRDRRL